MRFIQGILCLWLLGLSYSVFAQRVVDYNTHTWWSNVNKYVFSESWYALSEIHIRRADWILNWQQFLIRPSVYKKLSNSVVLTFGGTYIRQFPYGEQPIAMEFTELNLFEQVIVKGIVKEWRFSNRFRLENRRIPNIVYDVENTPQINSYSLKERIRYRLTFKRKIVSNSNCDMYLSFFDEVFILLDSKTFVPYAIQQNWSYAATGITKGNTSFELGYLHQIIKKSDGIHVEVNPTIQIAVKHYFDFRKPSSDS
jgi:hypothetical protein